MTRPLTAPCVAWLLNVDIDTLKSQIKKGELLAIKVGARWMIEPEDLMVYLLKHLPEKASPERKKQLSDRWIERIVNAEAAYKQFLSDEREAVEREQEAAEKEEGEERHLARVQRIKEARELGAEFNRLDAMVNKVKLAESSDELDRLCSQIETSEFKDSPDIWKEVTTKREGLKKKVR